MVTELKHENKTLRHLQELYETDDYLWLQEIIKILVNRKLDNLDIDNLVEELESLGKRDFNKVRSLLRQIIVHILLLEYWTEEYQRNYRHWQTEIIAFRDDLNHSLTKSLNNKLEQELPNIYQVAIKLVSKKTGFSIQTFPVNCPYSLEQLLDENWLP